MTGPQKPNEELRPISFRIKPSVAESIKNIARDNDVSMGEMVEKLVSSYVHNASTADHGFYVGTINRRERKMDERIKMVPFSGRVIFNSTRIEFKPALPYAELLTKIFGLEGFDFSGCVVGSSISVAELESYYEDCNLLIHEKLIIKKQEESDFLFCSQWVKSASANDTLAAYVSPFVSSNDIISVDSLFADIIEWEVAEGYAPNFD